MSQMLTYATETPEQGQTRAFSSIAERLQDPEIVSGHLQKLGSFAVNGAFGEELRPLDATAWQELIDPKQPTLGLRLHFINEVALCRAAQQLRAQGEPAPNIVMLPEKVFAKEWESKRAYYAQRGILVDKDGVLYRGEFPEPLQIHASQASETPIFHPRRFSKKIFHFNPGGTETLLEDKELTSKLLDQLELPHSRLLVPPTNAGSFDVESLFAIGKDFVIKPRHGQQGIGVRLVDHQNDTPADISRYIKEGYAEDTELIAEEWVHGTPFAHPESGAELDWNLRAIVMGDTYVGSYVRAGLKGSPINLACGAEAYSLEEAYDNCGLDDNQRALVANRVKELCEATRQIGAGVMGLDIIIDTNLQPHIIEINGEKSGGLENVMLAGKDEIDWRPAHAAVRGLMRFVSRQGPIRHLRHKGRASLALSTREILDGVQYAQSNTAKGQELLDFTLEKLRDPYGFPEKSQEAIRRFIESQENGLRTEIPADYMRIRDEMSKLLENEDRQALYELFNKAVAHDPTNITRLEAFASFISENDEETISRYCLLELEQETNPEKAQAIATMKYCSLLNLTELDSMLVSHETRRQVINALTTYYMLPLQDRTPRIVADVLDAAPEARYLAPVSRYFRGFANLAATMEEVIAVQHEAFLSDLASDGKFMESIASMSAEEKTEIDCIAIGIAKLHHNDLPAALAEFRLVSPSNKDLIGDASLALGRYLIHHISLAGISETTGQEIADLVSSSLFANETALQNLAGSANLTTGLCANLLLSTHYLVQGDPYAADASLGRFHHAASFLPEASRIFEGAYDELHQAITEAISSHPDNDESILPI